MRVLRHPAVFAIAALPLLFVALALDVLYLRPLTSGQASLDFRIAGFNPSEAIQYLVALGPSGRETLLVWHYLTVDLVLPITIALALAGYTYHAARRVDPFASMTDRALKRLSMIWVLPYLLVDYGQNIFVAAMLIDPIGTSQQTMRFASQLIILKFIFFGVGLVALGSLYGVGRGWLPSVSWLLRRKMK